MYANQPGTAPQDLTTWPVDSALFRPHGQFALVMFAHPRCPCTRATLAELGRTMARCRQPMDVQIVFTKPDDFPEGWERAGLWNSAESIPGVRTVTDPNGVEARRFGVTTSGHVALFDASGTLCFTGGLTSARAHEGDNLGTLAVRQWVNDGQSEVSQTRVFGCALFDEQATSGSGSPRSTTCCQQ